jgi:hypothetical protein
LHSLSINTSTCADEKPTCGVEPSIIGDETSIIGIAGTVITDENAIIGIAGTIIGDEKAIIGIAGTIIGDEKAIIVDENSIISYENTILYMKQPAFPVKSIPPLRGLRRLYMHQAGRCPTLSYSAPTGLKKVIHASSRAVPDLKLFRPYGAEERLLPPAFINPTLF